MTNLLTAAEAGNAIRVDPTDADLLQLLPLVDKFIEKATGRDWTQDGTLNNTAKACARMLIVAWYDNPSMVAQAGEGTMPLSFGLQNVLTQLEGEALKYRKYEFTGRNGAGAITLDEAVRGDTVVKVRGIYSLTGDQAAKFESTITENYQIQQTSDLDLSEDTFVVILKSPADDVIA